MAFLLRVATVMATLAAAASAEATKPGNLRQEDALADLVRPMRQLSAVWTSPDANNMAQMEPMEKLQGGDAIVVFHDSETNPESAVVHFDVLSQSNCVVSVCGTQRKWYMGEREKCFDLRVAGKSGNANENGLIRDISAAYMADRPVADRLYLKFDANNFIDGSPCEYEIVAGSKTIHALPLVGAGTSAVSSGLH